MQKDYRTCSFWATKLKNNRKNGAGDGKFEENQHSNENFKELAECILVEARNQQVFASVGSLAAEFLFRNGRPLGPDDLECPISSIGYLNSLNNSNGTDLNHFLARIFPKLEHMHLGALRVLLKMITRAEHNELAGLVDSRKLLRLWHQSIHLESPNELNRSIAKHMIELLKRFGPSSIEIFDNFMLNLPYFLRYKFLFLHYLLDSIPHNQLSESQMLRCFEQLALCLADRGCEATAADAFHSLASKFVESGKSELLVRLIADTLTSTDCQIQQNALRLWFPKLASSPQLRQLILALLALFRTSCLTSISSEHASSSTEDGFSNSFWYMDDRLDPSLIWRPCEIDQLLYLHALRWTIKTSGKELAAIGSGDAQLLRLALNTPDIKELIREAALDCTVEWLTMGGNILRHFPLSVDHLNPLIKQFLVADQPLCRRSLLAIFAHFFAQNAETRSGFLASIATFLNTTTCWNLTAEYSPTPGNLLLFMESVELTAEEENSLNMPDFLLKCLTYKHDSTVRQKSVKMALRFAKESAVFRAKLIRIFNKFAPSMTYGIGPLFELIQSTAKIDEKEQLEMGFVGEDEGMHIFTDKLRLEHGNRLEEDFDQFMSHCVEVNERLLQLGGSGEIAQCLTVSELHCNFEHGDDADEDLDLLCWSDSQRALLSRYSNGLIHSCSAIRWLITKRDAKLGEQSICNGALSLWSVLLRSHHKGVLEHCGSDFGACIGHLGTSHWASFSALIDEIVEKTISLLQSGGGQCRNIAFVKILLPILSAIDADQRFTLARRIVSLGQQNGANSNLCNQISGNSTHLHILFLLRALLFCASIDLSRMHAELAEFILGEMPQNEGYRESNGGGGGQAQRWRCQSMKANAFVALLHSVFRHFPANIPFNNFFYAEPELCTLFLRQIRQIRVQQSAPLNHARRTSRPALALLLAPLQRLFVAQFPFGTCAEADRFAEELCAELNALVRLEPSLLLRIQMFEVISNFSRQIEK